LKRDVILDFFLLAIVFLFGFACVWQQLARPPAPSEEWDGAAAKEAALSNDKFPRDYYEKPPLQGFYYTPKPNLIQQYGW